MMKLELNPHLAEGYHSAPQRARVVTESWVAENMFCPRCGCLRIEHFPNNQPVADFYCPQCRNEYELKSRKGKLAGKINDGAYDVMIERITSNRNPDFLFMSYSKADLLVENFIFIPKHFFVPDIIEKRKPLADTARRAGWVGCNIMIDKIPEQGRIAIVADGMVANMEQVVAQVQRSTALEMKDMSSRGWLMDVLNCVNQIGSKEFSLGEMYEFEELLYSKHPQNNNIKPKIRQQLQVLRARGVIEFLGRGKYRKL